MRNRSQRTRSEGRQERRRLAADRVRTRYHKKLASRLGERGAVLVEAALITPVLFTFILGTIEFGLAFSSYLTLANVTRDGVREASVRGDLLTTDFEVLQSINGTAATISNATVDRIVIFKATGPDDTVPATCSAGSSVANVCNVYDASDLTRPEDEFGCGTSTIAPNAPDRFWCPTDRETALGAGLDFVGVWVQFSHNYVTGLFGNTLTLTDTTILRLEPHEA